MERLGKAEACHQATAPGSSVQLREVHGGRGWPEEELDRPRDFDIPIFVNTDQSSPFGKDELLISEPPIVLENKPVSQASDKDLD